MSDQIADRDDSHQIRRPTSSANLGTPALEGRQQIGRPRSSPTLNDLGPSTRAPASPVLLGVLGDLSDVIEAVPGLEGPDAIGVVGSQDKPSSTVVLIRPITGGP